VIDMLHKRGAIDSETAAELLASYKFLAALDHNVRLTVGRTTRLPVGNQQAMTTIAQRMSISSPADLVEQLTVHRLNIRAIFDQIADPSS